MEGIKPLVIWGCKRGLTPICSIPSSDANVREAAKTMADIRDYISLNKTYIDFFSVEFVEGYKVYTGYRTSKDAGRDGFIAATLFVPKTQCVMEVRNLLTEVLGFYFSHYMNPLSCEPLINKTEDVRLFSDIIDKYDIVDDEHADFSPSRQERAPRYLTYDDVTELDGYLNAPCRPDFFECKKVFLLSKSILENSGNNLLELKIRSLNDEEAPLPPGKDTAKKDDDEELVPLMGKPRRPEITYDDEDSKPPLKKLLGVAAIAAVIILGLIFFLTHNGTDTSQQVALNVEEEATEQALPSDVYTESSTTLPEEATVEGEQGIDRDNQKKTVAEAENGNQVKELDGKKAPEALPAPPEDKQDEALLQKQIKQFHSTLSRNSITESEVKKILDALDKMKTNGKEANLLRKRCDTYLKFFHATSAGALSASDILDFTKEQQHIWNNTYKRNFKYTKENCGMNFQKAKAFSKY